MTKIKHTSSSSFLEWASNLHTGGGRKGLRWCLIFGAVFCILFCGIAVSLDLEIYGFWIILAQFFLLLLNSIVVLLEKNFSVFRLYFVRYCGFRPPHTAIRNSWLKDRKELSNCNYHHYEEAAKRIKITEIIENLHKLSIINLDTYLETYPFRQNLRKRDGRINYVQRRTSATKAWSSSDTSCNRRLLSWFHFFNFRTFPSSSLVFIFFPESTSSLCVIVSWFL